MFSYGSATFYTIYFIFSGLNCLLLTPVKFKALFVLLAFNSAFAFPVYKLL